MYSMSELIPHMFDWVEVLAVADDEVTTERYDRPNGKFQTFLKSLDVTSKVYLSSSISVTFSYLFLFSFQSLLEVPHYQIDARRGQS